MKNATYTRTAPDKSLFLLGVLALALVIGTGTAQADEWRGHERQAQQWHRQHFRHRHYDDREPYAVYAPPVIVEPPSGINFVIPLNIR